MQNFLLCFWLELLFVTEVDNLILHSKSFAVSSLFGIISSINDHIIETTPTQTTGHSEILSFPYPLCITLLKDLETLIEVAAQQFYGDDKKWNFIAATEAIK